MYGWDPEGGFHNAVWSGTLVIDGPCAYLDVSHQDATLLPEGEPLRSFLRLPEPLTRFDAAVGAVWVDEHGPMSSGDEVVVVGSEGWQQRWTQPGEDTHVFEFVWSNPADPTAHAIPVCAAHVSLYAASMSPTDSNGGEAALDPAESTRLLGLFAWDTDQAAPDVAVDLVLVLEPPCIYATPAVDPDTSQPTSPNTERYFVRLPRPLVRLDSAHNRIWVGKDGPMTTGDRVTLNETLTESAYGTQLYEGRCSAAGELHTAWMRPVDS